MLESQACDSINNLRVSGPSSPQKLMRWLVGGLPRAGRGREARQTGRRRTPPLASRARTKCLSPSTASGDSPGAFRTGCWSSQIRDVRQPGSKQIPGQPREPIPMPAKFADYTPFEQPAGPAVFPLLDGSSSSNRKESLLRSKWARPPGVVEGLDDLEHMESVEAMGVIIAGRLELLEEAVEKDLRYPLRRPSRTTSASSQPPCWKSTAEAVVEH
eukprot:CAMPEP_0206522774 /NCGR_PEP_ID=MMETSP0324_2-20121206/67187_2 /ASSEMBLY_ACC=CAM_ASM_000836 /TAXON_ID=2866 /ORGANISM="Crypthecodinium cohnii, Strain Seligo" /LENGTH=214 /DNA_ID=CAMNT_0054017011 /DNA_START=488 /DNA_END=1133 /DNA_ORIENTATION=-